MNLPLGFISQLGAAVGAYFAQYFADTNAAASQSDSAFTTSSDASGNIYASGSFLGATYYGGYVAKYGNGAFGWQRQIKDAATATANIQVRAGYSDASNNIYVSVYNTTTGGNWWLLKYNNAGTLQWQRTMTQATSASAYSGVYADASGNVYWSFGTGSANARLSVLIAKYNSSGTLQWQQYFGSSSGSGTNNANAVAADSSGNVGVAMYMGYTNNMGAILTYNSTGGGGNFRNVTDAGSTSHNTFLTDIKADSSGNWYVVGQGRNSANSGIVGWVAKYNSTLTIQWQRNLADGNAAASQNTAATCVYVDSSANLYVGGYYKQTGSSNISGFVAKYNTSGTLQWQLSFTDGVGTNTSVGGINQDASGNIVVSGQFRNSSSGSNAFNIKLPTTGAKTGTFAIDGTHSLIVSSASLTDSAGSFTDSAAAGYVNGVGTLTEGPGSLNDSAGSLTAAQVTI